MIHIDKILSAEKENAHIEAKAATGGVPQSMWETYSAFANTNGGVILLGVKEDTHSKKLIPVGVENPEKLISEIWNILHNAQKISENILLNENIYAINYRNMQLIVVEVPRAARQNRPVYLGRDMFTGTYRRSGEGDYRCKREEILAMLRDQTEEGVDSKVVESLMLEDLNAESLRGYRMMFSNRKPDHIWTKLSDEQFLHKIGAAKKGSDGCLHPTLAGLIFFGDFVTIMDELPNYFLDYRERMAADTRWSDRVCCSDGDREAKDTAAEVQKELRALAKEPSLGERTKRLEHSKRKLRESENKYAVAPEKLVNYDPVLPEELQVGDRVKLLTLDQNGEVLTLPDARGDLMVSVGIMKINANVQDLMLIRDGGKQKKTPRSAKYGSLYRSKAQNISSSVNVQGKTLDEAIMDVDKYLDDAYMAGLREVTVIHGLGTGVLRTGLRQAFRRHKHVDTFRKGAYNEGGDGVTIVSLKE